MQVRVKTDLYQNSSYLAHLLEHCVFSNQPSISNYFQIDQGVEGTSWINYTTFSLRADQDPQFFINHLMQPLDTRVIRNAQKLIKQEVREDFRSTGDLLINKIGKELYGKDFRRYAESWKISATTIQEYHQCWYHPDNIWILDNDYSILQRPQKRVKKSIAEKTDHNLLFVEWKRFRVQYKDFLAYLIPYNSWQAYTFYYFIDWLYYHYAHYHYRYLGKRYSPPIAHFFEFPQHLAFIKRADDQQKITKGFFLQAKEQFLWDRIALNEILAVYEITHLEQYSREVVESFIEDLKFELVAEIL